MKIALYKHTCHQILIKTETDTLGDNRAKTQLDKDKVALTKPC